MAYGMSAAKEAGLAQTQVWKRLMSMPVEQLKAAAHGEVPGVDMNLATLALRAKMTQVADQGVQAQQQLAQTGQGSVKERLMAHADQLPEMLGIGRLPAQNMEAVAAAQGGVVGYADGGSVEHYAPGGRVPTWEDVLAAQQQWKESETPWYLPTPAADPSAGAQARYKQVMAAYEGKKPLDFLAPLPQAPAAAPPVEPVKAPDKIKDALKKVTQPVTPVENPTKAEKDNMQAWIDKSKTLEDYMEKKFGNALDPIKDQLAKDREDYKTMKSENVGLALLGAAGALLKPGRSTASAIGEGLGTLGEYGMKFQPQMLAARQGISAGEVGLAQAQAQAARGNFSTAMQSVQQQEANELKRQELESQSQYQRDVGAYYRAKAGESGAGGGVNQKLYAQTYNNANKAWEKFVAGKGGSLYKPKPGEQEAFIKNYMQQSMPSLNLAGASSGYTGGPNIIRRGTPDPEDIMGG